MNRKEEIHKKAMSMSFDYPYLCNEEDNNSEYVRKRNNDMDSKDIMDVNDLLDDMEKNMLINGEHINLNKNQKRKLK